MVIYSRINRFYYAQNKKNISCQNYDKINCEKKVHEKKYFSTLF